MPSRLSRAAARALELLPRDRFSRVIGRAADLPLPSALGLDRRLIAAYSRLYEVDLSEAKVPPGGFASFDDFFTRELVEGARPVDPEEATLVSPADGKVEDAGPIERDASFLVKGQRYTVAELLGDERDVDAYLGGRFCIVYLSPRDYHRVHAPVAGEVAKVRHIAGELLPVNSFGVAHYPLLFSRSERVVFFQKSPAHGSVATVMVGAVGVGRISVSFDPSVLTNTGRAPCTHRYASPPTLAKGGELGRFHLGSTAIVLTGPSPSVELSVLSGQRVRVGAAIGKVRGDASEQIDAR